MAHITAPDALRSKQLYRYYVELASKQCDFEGVPDTRTIDVVVTQPTQDAIARLINACDRLKDWKLVSYWEPDFDEAPF